MSEIEKFLREAEKYINEGNYDKAMECYNKVIVLDDKNSIYF